MRRGSRKPIPRPVWVLSWVSFFADVSGEMIYPLLPLFVVGVLGSSKAELGIIEGVAVLVVALMSAFAGIRSDVSGRRVPWIRLGYGLPVLGKTILALASSWGFVLGGRMLDRVGKGLRGSPRDAIIADAVSIDQRGAAFGVHRAFDTAGAMLGVLASAALLWWLAGSPNAKGVGADSVAAGGIAPWTYRTVFGVGAALGLVSLALTFLVRESGGVREAKKPAADSAGTAPGRVSLPGSYWTTLGVLILFSFANSSDTFLLLRASELGFSPWAVVMVYAVFNLTYAVASYPAGVLSDRIGRRAVIAVGWVVYAVVYAGFAFLPESRAWGLWVLMGAYGLYMALTDGVGKALIADQSPREYRGRALGYFYALSGVTTLAASLVAGVVWDSAGPASAFLVGAGFAVLALVALGTTSLLARRASPPSAQA